MTGEALIACLKVTGAPMEGDGIYEKYLSRASQLLLLLGHYFEEEEPGYDLCLRLFRSLNNAIDEDLLVDDSIHLQAALKMIDKAIEKLGEER